MSSRHSHFLEGVLFGGLIGAIFALLLAPSSGYETRKKLKKMIQDDPDLIQDTKEKTEQLIHKTKEAIEEGFDKISTIIHEKTAPKKR